MPVNLDALSAQDRQDFESRLRVFGMDVSAVQEPLTVSGAVKLGYGPKFQSARQPFVVKTKDIAAVKRMVGLDDRVAKTLSSQVKLPSRITVSPAGGANPITVSRDAGQAFVASPGLSDGEAPGQFDPGALAQLDSEAVENIRLAARAYVRGNSTLVSSYRPLIEATLGQIIIPVFALPSIKVAAGSVLQFGPGVNALVAYEIEIEDGGVIRSQGHLTISCTKMTKPRKRPILTTAGNLTIGTFRPIFSE